MHHVTLHGPRSSLDTGGSASGKMRNSNTPAKGGEATGGSEEPGPRVNVLNDITENRFLGAANGASPRWRRVTGPSDAEGKHN